MNKLIVTFDYNYQFYGFVKPASLDSLLISTFLSINKRNLIIFNSFLYFNAPNPARIVRSVRNGHHLANNFNPICVSH
jgi:hypothetical protein